MKPSITFIIFNKSISFILNKPISFFIRLSAVIGKF